MYIEVSTISMMGTGIMNLPMPIALPELLAHMPDGLVVLDQRGVVMACNDAASHLLATPQRDWNDGPLPYPLFSSSTSENSASTTSSSAGLASASGSPAPLSG